MPVLVLTMDKSPGLTLIFLFDEMLKKGQRALDLSAGSDALRV